MVVENVSSELHSFGSYQARAMPTAGRGAFLSQSVIQKRFLICGSYLAAAGSLRRAWFSAVVVVRNLTVSNVISRSMCLRKNEHTLSPRNMASIMC